MPDIIITPSSGIIDFFPVSTRVGRIEGSGNTINIVNPSGFVAVSGSGLSVNTSSPNATFHAYSAVSGATLLNLEGTNGSLFSVIDNLSGTLMSVNNNAGLPVFEVFSDDRVVAGRFGQNDFIMTSGGNVGIGTGVPSSKFHVLGASTFNGDVTATGSFIAGSGSAALPSFEFINDVDTGLFSPAANTFGVSTSGVERLRVDSVGNIGIGTTSPTSRLQVSGLITANSGSFSNNVTASGFVRSGGTSSQFLKADGSVDSTAYTTNVGTVTSVAALTLGTTGTDVTSTVVTNTTTPVITLNIPTASASNRGALSNSDWTIFNNKQNALTNPVTGSSSNGYVSFWNGSTTQGGDANLFWDNTTKRLGIGTASPSGQLHIIGTGIVSSRIDIGNVRISNNSIATTSGNFDISPTGGALTVNGVGVILEGDARLDNARSPTAHTHSSSDITPNSYLAGDFSVLDGIVDSVSVAEGDWSDARENIIGAAALSHSHDTSVFNIGTISGSNAINYGQDRQIQTLTLNGTATTFTKGTGWPSSDSVARETTLNIFSSGNTSITWTIVNDWYRQPDSPLPSGRHIVLLRSVGSGTMQGHYIGNKTN